MTPVSMPLRRFTLAALAGLSLMAGCTLGPEYQRPELPLPAAWRVPPSEAADLANLEWWRGFTDPQLDEYIELALSANKDLLIAAQRVDRFEARLQTSQSANYPSIGYSTAASRERRSQERPNGLRPGESPYVNNFELGAGVRWELDLWGRVRRADEAARAELLSSQEARRGIMLSIASGVASGYVRLLELDQRLALARDAVKNRQDVLALAIQRAEGGAGSRIAVERARAEMEQSAAQIPPIERDLVEVENALSALLGRNPGPVARRAIDTLARPRLPQGVPADVLTRRPDIMAAEQDLVAANARIGVAKTGYFPTLSLSALLGLGADDTRWLFSETARTGSIGLGLAGTLFDGGRTAATIRESEAAAREMALRYQQTVLNALVEVETALATQDRAQARESAQDRVLKVRQEVARLARVRFDGGESAMTEVLEAELEVLGAKADRLQSQRETLLALVGVYKTMGGGWMQERDSRQAAAGEVEAQR
jgi:outer membrane protein, multidrug efflux system